MCHTIGIFAAHAESSCCFGFQSECICNIAWLERLECILKLLLVRQVGEVVVNYVVGACQRLRSVGIEDFVCEDILSCTQLVALCFSNQLQTCFYSWFFLSDGFCWPCVEHWRISTSRSLLRDLRHQPPHLALLWLWGVVLRAVHFQAPPCPRGFACIL